MTVPFGPPTINVGLTFYQQLVITGITVSVSVISSLVLFYVMFKTDLFFDLMERMTSALGKNHVYSDYSCTCSRCKFKLRTKKGLKQWKKDHKFKREDLI